jgi:hypothetical protein
MNWGIGKFARVRVRSPPGDHLPLGGFHLPEMNIARFVSWFTTYFRMANMVSRKHRTETKPSNISATELAQRYAEILDLRNKIKKAESNRRKRSVPIPAGKRRRAA